MSEFIFGFFNFFVILQFYILCCINNGILEWHNCGWIEKVFVEFYWEVYELIIIYLYKWLEISIEKILIKGRKFNNNR